MKKLTLLAIGILSFITLFGCAGSRMGMAPMNIAGNWTSTEGGGMTITQNGSDIGGTYTMKEGRIVGKLSGNTVKGYWIQNSSGMRCSTPHENSHYWGTMELVFTNSSYSGKWGYCGEKLNTPWTGQRR